MIMAPIIKTESLVKDFGKIRAVVPCILYKNCHLF